MSEQPRTDNYCDLPTVLCGPETHLKIKMEANGVECVFKNRIQKGPVTRFYFGLPGTTTGQPQEIVLQDGELVAARDILLNQDRCPKGQDVVWAATTIARATRHEGQTAQAWAQKANESEVALEAWKNQFGTSQLSHAIARLNAAEDARDRLTAELAAANKGARINALALEESSKRNVRLQAELDKAKVLIARYENRPLESTPDSGGQ